MCGRARRGRGAGRGGRERRVDDVAARGGWCAAEVDVADVAGGGGEAVGEDVVEIKMLVVCLMKVRLLRPSSRMPKSLGGGGEAVGEDEDEGGKGKV